MSSHQGMASLMLASLFLMTKTSPLNLSFTLLMTSLWVSSSSFMSSSVMFPSMVVVISFSTGMMILFCYCASMINFEKKNSSSLYLVLIITPAVMISNTEKLSEMTNMSYNSMMHQAQFLTTAIMVVVISMISINNSVFSHNKNSMSIY